MILSEWVPQDFYFLDENKNDQMISKWLDVGIVKKFSMLGCQTEDDIEFYHKSNPFGKTHRNIFEWVELENGYAVGYNESPSRGISLVYKNIGSPNRKNIIDAIFRATRDEVNIAKGKDYFYFNGDIPTQEFESTSVFVTAMNQLTVKQWVNEYLSLKEQS